MNIELPDTAKHYLVVIATPSALIDISWDQKYYTIYNVFMSIYPLFMLYTNLSMLLILLRKNTHKSCKIKA